MLSQMNIENVAVIERANLDFESGLNVLTGETGAGKSIIIDALSAVLGERTSKDIIRTGSKEARISALFRSISQSTKEGLEKIGCVVENNEVLLQRTISSDGKNVCYVSGRPVTVSVLREIGRLLVNTHGQHENQNLLLVDNHVNYLDKFGDLLSVRSKYEESYHRYCSIHKKIKNVQVDEAERDRKIDLLKYQIKEIEDISPVEGEEESLTEKCLFYKNNEQISMAIRKAMVAISSDSSDRDSALQSITMSASYLKTIENQFSTIKPLLDRLYGVISEFEDCESELREISRNLVFDEEEREQNEQRLSLIRRLLNKYGPTVSDVLDFNEKCRKELESIEKSDELLLELNKQLEQEEDIMIDAANELTAARHKVADKFVKQVEYELKYLDMPNVVLEVQFQKAPLTIVGAEKIEFCISTNPGEPAKPIAKIASGGELSRIMLAIKTVLANIDDIDTLIFDEIDNGISGRAAQKVGEKLYQIASDKVNSHQVLCVTHLAQIAAQAQHHFLIEKSIQNNRTYTTISPLNEMGRRREIARIISGEITSSALDAADEMLSRTRGK